MVQYRAHMSATLVSILSQINPVYDLPTDFFKIRFNIILLSAPESTKWSLSLRSPNQNPVRASPSSSRATCHAKLTSSFDNPNYILVSEIPTRCVNKHVFIDRQSNTIYNCCQCETEATCFGCMQPSSGLLYIITYAMYILNMRSWDSNSVTICVFVTENVDSMQLLTLKW
jgi:hypothetical protein